MEKNSRIYIAGHTGLVGSAIMRCLQEKGFANVVTRTHAELDLTRQAATEAFFEKEKPEYVFMAAARVGGLHANNAYMADFAMENAQMTINVLNAAFKTGVKKLLYLGSSCIYPREAAQPVKEEYVLSGPLEPTNEGYALAKILGVRLCDYYKRQYGANFISCMPANLYGPNDCWDEEKNHVIPALIQRFYKAKVEGLPSVVIWGSGKALREFMWIDDAAEACAFLMEHYEGPGTINAGVGEETSIANLSRLIAEIVGYKGRLEFDTSKPDGMPRRMMDSSKISKMGFAPKMPLHKGLELTYAEYLNREYPPPEISR